MATEPDKVDSSVLGTLVLVLGFGVLGTALAITALVRTQTDHLTAERSQTNDTAASLRGSQEADLHLPPAYIDQSAGTVRLPIERAMQVVVRDLARNPQSATWPKPEPKPSEVEGAADAGVEGDGAQGDGATHEPTGAQPEEEQREQGPGKKPQGKAPKLIAPRAPVPVAPKPAPAPAAPPAPPVAPRPPPPAPPTPPVAPRPPPPVPPAPAP